MAIETTGNHPKALWPGVHDFFGATYNQHDTEYTDLFDVKGSGQNYEEDVEQTSYGLAPIKPEGQSTNYDDRNQGYTKRYIHVAYSMGYVVTREELADNLYEKVSNARAQSLAWSMNQTRENVGANVFNRAFTSAYTGGDGLELCSEAHTGLSGTWSNELATGAALSEAAIEDLCIQIMDATNSRGLKIGLRPTRLLIPTAESFEAERILKSNLRVGTADNDLNALKSMGAIPGWAVNHYFTDSTLWYIRTDAPNGMCWFDREGVEFTKDNDFDTDNAKAKAYMRFSTGWTDPRGVYGSDGP
jgi:hypothetical protein